MRTKLGWALTLVVIAAGLAAGGIHVGEADDAPGAALLGVLLALGLVALAFRIARSRQ